jgi:rubrerythrin
MTVLSSARKLEKEGYDFYMKAAFGTENRRGEEMFTFLAHEEVKHYNIVDELIAQSGGQRTPLEKERPVETGVFGDAQGGRIWGKSDDLDALNVGIMAEHKSIETYSRLHDQVKDAKIRKIAKKLVDEEKRHLSILEKEVEFVTDTGEYHDFKTITM